MLLKSKYLGFRRGSDFKRLPDFSGVVPSGPPGLAEERTGAGHLETESPSSGFLADHVPAASIVVPFRILNV